MQARRVWLSNVLEDVKTRQGTMLERAKFGDKASLVLRSKIYPTDGQ